MFAHSGDEAGSQWLPASSFRLSTEEQGSYAWTQ